MLPVGNFSARSTIATSYVPHFCTTLPYSNTDLYYFVRIYGQCDSYVEHRFGPMRMEQLTKEDIFTEVATATWGSKEVEVERELASGGINHISRTMDEFRDANANILRKLSIALLQSTEIVDSASLFLTTANILSLASIAMDLPDEAQFHVVALVRMLTKEFAPITNAISDEEVLQLITQLAVAGMRMMEGLKLQLDSPLPLEVNAPHTALDYDTDIDAEGKLVQPLCSHNIGAKQSRAADDVLQRREDCTIINAAQRQREHCRLVWKAMGELDAALAGAMQLGTSTHVSATTRGGGFMHFLKISNLPQLHEAAAKLDKLSCSSFSVRDLTGILSEFGTIIIQNHDFKYPNYTTGLEGDRDVRLPDAVVAVDGSRVYEPLVMFNYLIEDFDVAFSLEFQAQLTAASPSCPQFLVVAR
ncbi:hypothetical protein TSMEX_006566 [Taenia solium]|eukprot:TsM_001033000 transcript=TsM_001033000 gene=TsM_001033000